MLVYNFGTTIWRLGKGVNIWNLLWLSKRLIICNEYTDIYINTLPNAFTSQTAKKYRDNLYIFCQTRSYVYATVTAHVIDVAASRHVINQASELRKKYKHCAYTFACKLTLLNDQ